MADYFDEDDLINDYIDDFDEPPDEEPDIPEEFLSPSISTNRRATISSTNVNESNVDKNATEQIQKDAVDAAIEAGQRRAALDETNETSSSQFEFSYSDPKRDLYKFQRYTRSQEWRKVNNKSLASKIRKRKHEIALKAYKDRNQKIPSQDLPSNSAAAVQLVQYAQHSFFPSFLKHDSLVDCLSRYGVDSSFQSPKKGQSSTPITLNNGDQIHILQRYINHSMDNIVINTPDTLLGIPMSTLMKRTKSLERSQFHIIDQENNKDTDETTTYTYSRSASAKLWVDKHAPQKFAHLLSDERINREVLRCIRAWDPYVFHRDAPARPEFIRQRMEQQDLSKQSSDTQIDNNESEHDKRPPLSSRVILLCGPPGVGKTTLAHVIAHHAGYLPTEINASDDRTASILTDRIQQAMESKTSFYTQNSKPNCLILDEIDGASDKATMNAILNIIKADLPPPRNQNQTEVGVSKNKKPRKNTSKTSYLRRPMIFIANHKFASVLRPLLPYAKVFDVTPPSEYRLISRLKAILSQENFTIHSSEQPLRSLAKGSGGDIRSCLHTLQFAASGLRKKRQGKSYEPPSDTLMDISQALLSAIGGGKKKHGIGSEGGWKDERTDMVDTLITIFRRAKQNEKNKFTSLSNKAVEKDGVEKVLQTMESFNDGSKIIDSLFTNLPSIPYIDPALDRSSTAHEWLSAADLLRSYESTVAQNNMMEYMRIQRLHIPPAAAAIHLLCRIETKLGDRLIFSTRKMNDARFQLEANSNLLLQFIHNLPPDCRKAAGGNTAIITDLLPYALWLLSAGNGGFSLQRAVSSLEILNESEKKAFWEHVKRLRALGLTYVKAEEGIPGRKDGKISYGRKLRLEPEINQLVIFEAMNQDKDRQKELIRNEIPSTVKELLAHEAAIEGMRDRENPSKEKKSNSFEQNRDNGDKMNNIVTLNGKRKPITKEDDESKEKRSKKNFLLFGAYKAKAARSARNAALAGYGRSKRVRLTHSGSNIPLSHVIRFKYQKGFTQAVRIPCKMEDFL